MSTYLDDILREIAMGRVELGKDFHEDDTGQNKIIFLSSSNFTLGSIHNDVIILGGGGLKKMTGEGGVGLR